MTSIKSVFRGLIGHRGSPKRAPENTMPSFERANQDGAAAVELDVQLSKDGELVVIHDGTLDRTTNGSGPVDEKSLAELKELDAGSFFGPEFKGTKIPTLRESLQWAKGKSKLDIEVKKEAAAEMKPADLAKVIMSEGMESQVAVSSFDQDFIESLEDEFPQIETAVLYSAKPTFAKVKKWGVAGLVAGVTAGVLSGGILPAIGLTLGGGLAAGLAAYRSGVNEVESKFKDSPIDAVLPHWLITSKGLVDEAHASGKKVAPYTVNDKRVAAIMRNRGVDGMITDHPEGI